MPALSMTLERMSLNMAPNVLVNGRLLLAGPFHLELGGNATCSQVFRLQTGVLCDTREHSRTDFFAVVKREDKVR